VKDPGLKGNCDVREDFNYADGAVRQGEPHIRGHILQELYLSGNQAVDGRVSHAGNAEGAEFQVAGFGAGE
jgi:hypothetical protein